jgi:exodeoxyribonuclease V alpha subunit
MESELQGQIERITYTNEENAYTVAKIKSGGHKGLVTVIGNLLSVNPGEIIRMKGVWQTHPKFGDQFKISSYISIKPATVVGIEKYLGSGLVKGIGPVMAKRITAHFGDKTLEVIDEAIGRLTEVAGIGKKRLDMIQNAWAQQREIKDIMIFLQGHGVSSAYAVRIYKHYGSDAVRVVSDNPYQLAYDVHGIGFITADKIAEKLGFTKDSPLRAEAGALYVLSGLADDGHVYYPLDILVEECVKILDIEAAGVLAAIKRVEAAERVVLEAAAEHVCVYLKQFYTAECGIAANMSRIAGFGAGPYAALFPLLEEQKLMTWVKEQLGIELAQAQVQAVRESLKNRVMVITGGPGTGKTTIVKSIVSVFERLGKRAVLAAPTGRAAKRLSEATGQTAKTLHRLLEFGPVKGGFAKNDKNRLQGDLFIIDETSMVDTVMMHHFLKAVPAGATLILVGDIDQLPSVGAGNVLGDIIASGAVCVVRLNEIFRQASRSLIVVNAHKINQGEFPIIPKNADSNSDFYFFDAEEPERVLEKIIELCVEKIPRKFHLDPLKDIQVLTAMHRGSLGATNLNAELQRALNPSKSELARGGKLFKPGDKVMQILNNYNKDVYNGDIGRIARIGMELQEVHVDFDGRMVLYDFKDLDEIALAYAVSVHKSQGSEYPAIIMPIHTQQFMLLQRNLLYTAVTRGKRLVVLVGTKKALFIAIKNDKTRMRYTQLENRLRRAAR